MESLGQCTLEFPKYKYWFEAILSDDSEVITKELNTKNDSERKKLLNGIFNLNDAY